MCFSTYTVFDTLDWDRNETKLAWPIHDGKPKWPGPETPGDDVNNQNQTQCYFRGLTENTYPYDRRSYWWRVLAARLGFVVAFVVNK